MGLSAPPTTTPKLFSRPPASTTLLPYVSILSLHLTCMLVFHDVTPSWLSLTSLAALLIHFSWIFLTSHSLTSGFLTALLLYLCICLSRIKTAFSSLLCNNGRPYDYGPEQNILKVRGYAILHGFFLLKPWNWNVMAKAEASVLDFEEKITC